MNAGPSLTHATAVQKPVARRPGAPPWTAAGGKVFRPPRRLGFRRRRGQGKDGWNLCNLFIVTDLNGMERDGVSAQ